jgi:hypothetical protein
MRSTRVFFLVLILLSTAALAALPAPARAAPARASCNGLPEVEWQEARTQAFAILYPAGSTGPEVLSTLSGEELDAEYARFEALFETSLNLPVSIRIYPSINHYYCLNAQAPEILPGATHSHVGSREIALLAENIAANFSAWLSSSRNVLRYEQAVLFAQEAAGENIPPGLLVGIGHYAQDPAETMGSLGLTPGSWGSPGHTWRELWEDPLTQFDFGRKLQATSTVAFLVEQGGWASLVEFLKSLPTSASFSQSLQQVFGQDLASLQNEWQEYYPRYFQGRWQVNALYNYDLTPYEELVKAGSYVEAGKGLQEVIPFLEKTNQTVQLYRAQNMLAMARSGQEAEKLVAQSLQALQDGDLTGAIGLIDQAQHMYSQVGNVQRLDELNAYRDQAFKIQALHEEFGQLQAEAARRPWGLGLGSRLISLDQRLGKLGDIQGQLRVRELARLVEAGQREIQMLASLAGAAFVLGLLGLRIWLLRRPPAVEAQL